MALNAAVVFEVRTGGSDANNGGGFRTGATGTDRSLQDAAHATLTTASTVHTTTTQINVAVGNYTVTAGDVGNIVVVNGGTATAGRYEITVADVPNNRWTVDRAVGTAAQTVAGGMGGALASPGLAASLMTVAGQSCWIKSGTYNMTTSTAGAGGPLTMPAVNSFIGGYQTTRGDNTGTRPNLVWTAGAPGGQTFMWSNSTGQCLVWNITFDGNNVANVSGMSSASGSGRIVRCSVSNCSQSGMMGIRVSATAGNGVAAHDCLATSCETGFSSTGGQYFYFCSAISCGTGYSANAICCLADGSTTVGFSGPTNSTHQFCTANGTSAGPGFAPVGNGLMLSCLATNNSTYGYDASASPLLLVNCASYNNTSGRTDTAAVDIGAITVTADPYVNLAGDDFRPNAVAGGGLLLRGAGIGIFGQTDNRDVGAVQSTAAGGGLLVHPGMSGGV